MDPNWISGLAAVVSSGVAIGALVVAARANSRSDKANEQAAIANDRAADALDLQRRIDDRQREFRLVRWTAAWDRQSSSDMATVLLENTGQTPAVEVTVVITTLVDESLFEFDRVAPGQRIKAALRASDGVHAAFHSVRPAACRVHWSSPRGEVSSTDLEIAPMHS